MRHTLPQNPQFYVTAPQDCPYLDNQVERKLFTALYGISSRRLNNSLSKQGFSKVRVDGNIVDLSPGLKLDRYKNHDIEILIDRFSISKNEFDRISGTINAVSYTHLTLPTSDLV